MPEQRTRPSAPIASPETADAIWAPVGRKLLYGVPGASPLFALQCNRNRSPATIEFTRYAAADPHSKAILALIGNGHVKRLKIDATRVRDAWLWQGALAAGDPAWDVLTGAREVEATVPGAGSLKLNPSGRPGELIENCRSSPGPELQAVPR